MRSLPLLSFMVFACVGSAAMAEERAAGTAPAEHLPLTTVAEIFAQPATGFNVDRPISLTGVLTLADPARNLLVLQDETGAIALRSDAPGTLPAPGQRITVKASACAPYIVNRPEYPYEPAARDIQEAFEEPDEAGNFRLSRMRAWLCPPTTGHYTFWLASDDSSDLWLSTRPGDPTEARRIATVSPGLWTGRREWTRFASQRSETLFLQAGKSYYIETLHEQRQANRHLSVAWQGPQLDQAVIDGQFLVPYSATGDVSPRDLAATKGVLREYWNHFHAGDLAHFLRGPAAERALTVHGMEISLLGQEAWPAPVRIVPRAPLEAENWYRWAEGEGVVSFLAFDGSSLTIHLASGNGPVVVRVARWEGNPPSVRPNLRVKFRGVCEGGNDEYMQLTASYIWVPSQRDVSFFEGSPETSASPDPRPPSSPTLGGWLFTRGVVTFHDRVRDKECLFVQDTATNAGIFISQAKRRFDPPLQVGQCVEIGGFLVPGKYAPWIRPVTLNHCGMQALPVPAIPAPLDPATSYRHGLWTEVEGVVRTVKADGTIMLMAKHEALAVWLGGTERDGLQQLVNSTLRLLGVMSLETFDTPVLLVPSRSYVEVVEPAPEVPAQPLPIAELRKASSKNQWPHQVKIAGAMTYRDERSFFLEDDSGAVRVQPGGAPPSEIGGAFEIVGFPDTTSGTLQITEAAWDPLPGGRIARTTMLSPPEADHSRHGTLVTVEAKLLSQKNRGADQILELQAGGDVFEAVLETPRERVREFQAGSQLGITGVCILESSPGITGSTSDGPPVALARLLLRSPADISLLRNPPWWTWEQAAILVGALGAVVVGSLLRIQFLHRRFAQQQAARLAFARELLERQECERRRIAASLHDSLGQNLLVIRSQAQMAMQSVEQQSATRERLEQISGATLEAIDEVCKITHNLRPYHLDRLGLTQAIRAMIRTVSETCSTSFACQVEEIDGIIDRELEIHVYRIVQEAVNNIVKHSGATEAVVVIKRTSGNLSISIRDNGRGFALNAANPSAGFGLGGLRERAEIMRGTARIHSSSGDGVIIQIDIPISPQNKCDPVLDYS